MTNEDKKLIADYMGWTVFYTKNETLYVEKDCITRHYFDANDASLCVKEMQKRGDWQDFVQITSKIHKLGFHSEVIAWLFDAENFFEAMSQWRLTLMKEAIIKILVSEFSHIYCYNCNSQNDRENCDDCHRKSMGWSISETTAGEVADKIIGLFGQG